MFWTVNSFESLTVSNTVSLAFIGYVQTKPSSKFTSKFTTTKWILTATRDQVPGEVYSNGEFLVDVDGSDDQPFTSFKLHIFSTVDLNHHSRQERGILSVAITHS